MLTVKRIYEAAEPGDGYRVLVERLWPRGVSKSKAALDEWMKDIAPSQELREWFDHDPAKWKQFQARYSKELAGKQDLIEQLKTHLRNGVVTLLYGAKDEKHNSALVLKAVLARSLK
jgi:uncharacterized protein YeaO (DUF488 family)